MAYWELQKRVEYSPEDSGKEIDRYFGTFRIFLANQHLLNVLIQHGKHLDKPIDKFTNSRLFEIYKESNSLSLQSLQAQISLGVDINSVLPDSFVLIQVSKMLQNVECQLFSLDYSSLSWRLDKIAFRPQFFLKSSLSSFLKKILQMASQRSRLSAAVNFLNKNKYRKIYSQLGMQIAQMLIVFQEIVLELTNQCTLLQFMEQSEQFGSQIQLLYNLVINQEYIMEEGKMYEDFDFRFLHSEALIFKRILKLARNSDAVVLQTNPLVLKLLQAAFRPLFVLLEKLLFEQCGYLQLNSELYLRYYFADPRALLEAVAKKLVMVKQESIQLYLICKVKEQIQLVHSLRELRRYERRWENTFTVKRKLIDRIRKHHKQRQQWQYERKREEKMRDIYEIKNRLFQAQQEEANRKRSLQEKNQQELQRLKREIDEKQIKRKLIEQLQKERQKGILLDIQLREKRKLANKKQEFERLLAAQEQPINPNQQIKLNSNQSMKLQSNILEENNEYRQILATNEIDIQKSVQAQGQTQKIIQKKSPASEDIIPSQGSIPQFHHKYMQTAEAFLSGNQQKHGNKAESYFKIVDKRQRSSESAVSQIGDYWQLEVEMLSESEDDKIEEEIEGRQIDIQTCLGICIDDIVRKQSDMVRRCLEFIVVDKYQILGVIQFLRNALMSGNGERVQQFIRVSMGEGSLMALRHFSQCLLFDTSLQHIQRLAPAFYHSKSNMRHITQSIILALSSNTCPVFSNPIFHIFTFPNICKFFLSFCALGIRKTSYLRVGNYSTVIISICRKRKKQGKLADYEMKFMGRLCVIRYKISNFLKTFENYLFFRVIQKEYKIMRAHITELNQLEQNHIQMLDNIIKYGFIDNPSHNITKTFRQLLAYVHQFHQIVYKLTLDDIAAYEWEQIQQKIKLINTTFDKELKNIEVLLFRFN